MSNKSFSRIFAALWLTLVLFTVSLPVSTLAQTAAKAAPTSASVVAPEYAAQLAKIEEKFEAGRAALGIPGASIAIVKDDKIIYLKGLGYKDFENKTPATLDTEFSIGSATKAFTALSVLMNQEAGKLALDDSPKKYLPFFKINDPDTDARITIRDLLSHSSGLSRTDLAMVTGKLNREELIRVVGEAKPTARLREKFQYQNIMFAAAGEIVARTSGMPWEKFVAEKIFAPLGMTNSNLATAEMARAKDRSFGYEFNADTKETRNVPYLPIDATAPAGAINSSARDMAKWLQFMINGGVLPNGKRLVAENLFAELTKPQMKIQGKMSYGLGWFLQDWNGLKVVQHGGNINGFNSLVAMIPEKKIGFVILTNVSASPLPQQMMPIIWENLLGSPNQNIATTNDSAYKPESEIGKYRLEAAGIDVEIKMVNGKLTAIVPGQPEYVLELVGARKYKLTGAPDGFFVTFKDSGAYFEQPQGNYNLPKVKTDNSETKPASEAVKELIGKYDSEKNPANGIEIAEKDGKVSLVVAGQPPYELRERAKDVFFSPALPEGFGVKAKRDAAGKLAGIILVQPNGEFAFNRAGALENANNIAGKYRLEQPPAYEIEIAEKDGKLSLQVPNQPAYELKEKEKDVYFSPTIPDVLSRIEVKRDASGKIVGLVSTEPSGKYSFKRIAAEKPTITADELMAKVVDALGGEANWRKLNSRVARVELDFVNQGVKGAGVSYAKAPNMYANDFKFVALGKEIAQSFDYFDGKEGGQWISFSPFEKYTGKMLEDTRIQADFYGFLNWKIDYKTASVKGATKVGDEDAYVVVFEPEKGNKQTVYFSQKTFLPLKRESVISSSTSGVDLPFSETYSDYRTVDNIKLPFRTVNSNIGSGDLVTTIKEVKHNVAIDDKTFKLKK